MSRPKLNKKRFTIRLTPEQIAAAREYGSTIQAAIEQLLTPTSTLLINRPPPPLTTSQPELPRIDRKPTPPGKPLIEILGGPDDQPPSLCPRCQRIGSPSCHACKVTFGLT
jgi:hypothetical protein